MSQYLFGVKNGKLDAKEQRLRRRVAKKHGVEWVYVNLPGDGYRSWFAGPNLGFPFDRNLSDAVHADLTRED